MRRGGVVEPMVAAAGIDTWSVCWYLPEESPVRRGMEHMATERAARSRLLPESIEGHRVGWFPGTRMMFAEGHPTPGALAPATALPAAMDRLTQGLADRGLQVPDQECRFNWSNGLHGIRRLDATVDLHFDSPAEGLATLAGVAALPLPRMKTQVMREVGGRRVETVYFRGTSGKRVLGRWYDKGIESGDAGRGLHVRPEDQRRFSKESRPTVEEVASTTYVRDSFVRRFEPLWRASKGVKVAGSIELAQRLRELVEEGELSPTEAKSMAGYLVLEQAEANFQSRATKYRDRARCRNHGLVLADGVLDEVEINLGEVLEHALDAEVWGARG